MLFSNTIPKSDAEGHNSSTAEIAKHKNTEGPLMNPDSLSPSSLVSNPEESCKDVRDKSPLDTIADIACRIGAKMPIRTNSEDDPYSLPGHAFPDTTDRPKPSPSPACLGMQHHTPCFRPSFPVRQSATDHGSLEQTPHSTGAHGKAEIPIPKPVCCLYGYHAEILSKQSDLGHTLGDVTNLVKSQHRESQNHVSQQVRAFAEKLSSQMREDGFDVDNINVDINNLRKDINTLRNECSSALRTLQATLEARAPLHENQSFSLRPRHAGIATFVVKPHQMSSCNTSPEQNGDIKIRANELTISIEPSETKRHDSAESGSRISDSDAPYQPRKKVKVTCVQNMKTRSSSASPDDPLQVIKGSNVPGRAYDSGNSSFRIDEMERRNSQSQDQEDGIAARAGSRSGRRFKTSGNGVSKRRRDNWSNEENDLFVAMVMENLDMEEMSLRRMLARRFSPRRTHEQCANHLRILRAQKKLPPAKEEATCNGRRTI